MKKWLKRGIVFFCIGSAFIAALFIDVKDVYYSYTEDDMLDRIKEGPLLEEVDRVEKEVSINYLGGNVYSLRIGTEEILIKRIKAKDNVIRYRYFYQPTYFE